jgi:parallel beta-helix repeat protein
MRRVSPRVIALAAAALLAGCADHELPLETIQPHDANLSQVLRGNSAGIWSISMAGGLIYAPGALTQKTEEFSVSMRIKPLSTVPAERELMTNTGSSFANGWSIYAVSDGSSNWHLEFYDLATFTPVQAPQATLSVGQWHTLEVGRHAGRWFAKIDSQTSDLGPNPVPEPIPASEMPGYAEVGSNFSGWIDSFALSDLDTHATIEAFPLEEGRGTTVTGSHGTVLNIAGGNVWMPTALGLGGSEGGGGQAISACGAVITQPGDYALTRDLVSCPGTIIDIRSSNVRLRLDGHVISGTGGTIFNGVAIDVGVKIPGGVHDVFITGPGEIREVGTAIALEGVSSSAITAVTIDFDGFGISPNAGFGAGEPTHYSSGNLIALNRIMWLEAHAITVNGGAKNIFSANDIENNSDGILLYAGGSNTLIGNVVLNNFGPGIYTTPNPDVVNNLITANRATGNGPDLQDRWGDCTHNRWVANSFQTSDPACIK